ncbi:RNA splicing factor PRP9 [Auricularia subglabra TFB-10046 SS5]|nr:RNA splicing factor PRP9 [Auricularia subglabra TFB-10046 SS5]
MDSVFEIQRQTHEEVERLQRALSTVLSHTYPTQQAHIANQHKASQLLERISNRVYELNASYNDDAARKAELDALSAPAALQPGADDLAEFYTRLGRLREHHLKYPDTVVGAFETELAALVDEPLEGEYEDEDPLSVMFSGEEAYGRYLDLYAQHTAYCNLKDIRRTSYMQYLSALVNVTTQPVHAELSMETRLTKEYESYLRDLHAYLLSFTRRTRPLTDVDKEQLVAEAEFTTLWDAGQCGDWQKFPTADSTNPNGEGQGGIWCAACQKSYSKQTVYDAHLTSKKHLKAEAKLAAAGATNGSAPGATENGSTAVDKAAQESKNRRLARLTHLTTALLQPLANTLAETKSNVERRFALTAREREQELLDAPTAAAQIQGESEAPPAEEEQEEEKIYNPLKLPLGWDGKPIPYWLYKLHGLGVEYRCEICSDHVYMGRKNFERHFQESRHAFGMRALGLPNTKHFHEITRIEDALALAERLKQEGRQEVVQNETTEELEDEDGNVYNRKTYDDLKKQGIIR